MLSIIQEICCFLGDRDSFYSGLWCVRVCALPTCIVQESMREGELRLTESGARFQGCKSVSRRGRKHFEQN